MARKGRKQLSVLITEEHFTKLEQIKEEKGGLSNAKIVEMLLDAYINTNINTNTLTVESVTKMIQDALTNINTFNKPAPIYYDHDDYNPEEVDCSNDIDESADIPMPPPSAFYGELPPIDDEPYDPREDLKQMKEEESKPKRKPDYMDNF